MNAPSHFLLASLVAASFAILGNSRAADKKDPDKKPEPAKEVVVKDQLITADLKDTVRTQMYCKTYTFKMIEGRNYQLDMTSADFDSYLRLEEPSGQQIAADDDSGGFPHARIVIRAPKTGDYTIITTTYRAGATGKFMLTVKDLTGGPPPKNEPKDKKFGRLAPIPPAPHPAPQITSTRGA